MNKSNRVVKLDIKLSKADNDDEHKGDFEGYGNVFDVVDSYRDVVMPGAFTQTLEEHAERGTMPKLLWQHDAAEPIGIWNEMKEDDHGLFGKGQLLVDQGVPNADKAYALVKAGALDGLSIGFSLYPGGQHCNDEANVLELTNINLWETSIVTFAANEPSKITEIRCKMAAGELPTVREFEGYLREVGFSQAEAKAIISTGFKSIQREAGEHDELDLREATSIMETIEQHNLLLTGK